MSWIRSLFGIKQDGNPPYSLEAIYRTGEGKVRTRNEDSLLWIKPDDPKLMRTHGCLAVIADGMGGHEAGDVASKMAVSEIEKNYYRSRGSRRSKALRDAVTKSHQAVQRYAKKSGIHGKMGSTCTAVVFDTHSIYTVQVGDSRLYRFCNDKLEQLTRDQTMAEALFDRGQIKATEVHGHPQAHILTQAMGANKSLSPAFQEINFQKGQTELLFMCSDGVTNEMSDGEIQSVFQNTTDLFSIDKQIHQFLMNTPLRDNYSYICILKRPLISSKGLQATRIIQNPSS